jgi:hypothetical protein
LIKNPHPCKQRKGAAAKISKSPAAWARPTQPGERVNNQLPFVFWRNDYRRLKREAHTPSAIRALLAQGVDNLFAAQAIGNVLKSKIYSGILPRVVDG